MTTNPTNPPDLTLQNFTHQTIQKRIKNQYNQNSLVVIPSSFSPFLNNIVVVAPKEDPLTQFPLNLGKLKKTDKNNDDVNYFTFENGVITSFKSTNKIFEINMVLPHRQTYDYNVFFVSFYTEIVNKKKWYEKTRGGRSRRQSKNTKRQRKTNKRRRVR
jgi:hypothetical protein